MKKDFTSYSSTLKKQRFGCGLTHALESIYELCKMLIYKMDKLVFPFYVPLSLSMSSLNTFPRVVFRNDYIV
jgi:hypothetical protein